MGLLVDVYRNSCYGDCSNNGISKFHNRFCVSNVEGPFEPSEKNPELVLTKGPYNTVRLIDPNISENVWVMFGGNYAGTSDSRFSAAIEDMVGYSIDLVKIFDRVEH